MPDTTRPEEEHYGRFERGDGQLRLRFTRRLPHPLQQVWRALTASEHLAAWFPTTIEGERAAGAPLRFAHRDGIAPPFEGEMLAFQPPSLMELRWGQDILRFELRPAGDETVLDFTDTFDELGRAARDGAGWHGCLDALGYEVAGQPSPWSSGDRWRQVRDAYVERLGAEASTIGPPREWERAHDSASADAS